MIEDTDMSKKDKHECFVLFSLIFGHPELFGKCRTCEYVEGHIIQC